MSETYPVKGDTYILARGRETREFIPVWTGPLADKPANQATMREWVALAVLQGILQSKDAEFDSSATMIGVAMDYTDQFIAALEAKQQPEATKPETWQDAPISVLNGYGTGSPVLELVAACRIRTCWELEKRLMRGGFISLSDSACAQLQHSINQLKKEREAKP